MHEKTIKQPNQSINTTFFTGGFVTWGHLTQSLLLKINFTSAFVIWEPITQNVFLKISFSYLKKLESSKLESIWFHCCGNESIHV